MLRLAKFTALVQAWADTDKKRPIFAPEARLFEVEALGYTECVSGAFRIAPGDDPFEVPRGSVTTIAAALIVVEGAAGADLTINGAGSARELRPVSDVEDAAEGTPRAFYLETCADLSATPPFVIAHPGPGTADPIEGWYVLVGDRNA